MRNESKQPIGQRIGSEIGGTDPNAVIREVQEWMDHPSWDTLFPSDLDNEDVQQCISLFSTSMESTDQLEGVGSRPREEYLQRFSEDVEDDDVENASSPERFSYVCMLGAGGFGIVLRVFDKVRKCQVAVKFLRPSLRFSRVSQRRFLREVQITASLEHDGILGVLETGYLRNFPFIMTAIVDGPDLARFLARNNGRIAEVQAVACIAEVAESLHFAHERGVLHRDLKPSNILLAPINDRAAECTDFVPKLTDFGLAKRIDHLQDLQENLSTGFQFMGTLRYMAPEQAAGRFKDVGIASDVYSLGAILYQCVTGTTPHNGNSKGELLTTLLRDPVVPPRRINSLVSKDLENIILKCLSREPQDRYASAGELVVELRHFQAGEPIMARRAGPIRCVRYWARQNPGIATVSAALAIVTCCSMAIVLMLYFQAAKAVKRSERMLDLTLMSVNDAYVDVAEEILDEVPDSAEKCYQLHQHALEVHQKLAEEFLYDTRSRYRLSVQYRYAGEAAERTERIAESREDREKCIAILQQLLTEDPGNLRYQYDIFFNRKAIADGNTSPIVLERLKDKEAVHFDICRLLELGPGNPDYEEAAAGTKMVLAGDYVYIADPRAELLFQQAFRISDRLFRLHPNKLLYAKYSLLARAQLADLYRDQGKLDDAIHLGMETKEILQRITSPEKNETWFLEIMREPKRSLAETYFTQGKWSDAAGLLRECVVIDTTLQRHFPTFHRYTMGRCQFLAEQLRAERHLGISSEAEAKLLTELETQILEWQKFLPYTEGIAAVRQKLNDTSTKPLKAGR